MAYETVLYEVADQIATITLNRPAKMNSYTPTMGMKSPRPCCRPMPTPTCASSS